jgi:hypothetical protein
MLNFLNRSLLETPAVGQPRNNTVMLLNQLTDLLIPSARRIVNAFYNGVKVQQPLELWTAISSNHEEMSISDVLSMLDLPTALSDSLEQEKERTLELFNIITQLNQNNPIKAEEGTVQLLLTEQWRRQERNASTGLETGTVVHPYAKFIDCHKTNHNLPFYKYPMMGFVSEHVLAGKLAGATTFPKSGLPDYVSFSLPMFLEIKTTTMKVALHDRDYELIQQAVERVFICGKMNETLQRIFAFASNGKATWMVVLRRTYGNEGEESAVTTANYHIIRISTEHLFPLWHIITNNALDDPSYYRCDESVPIMKAISKLNYHLSHSSCKIINYKKNGTSLWSILPALDDKSVESTSTEYIIVKIAKMSRGNDEIEILKKLKETEVSDYVLATMDFSKNEFTSWPNIPNRDYQLIGFRKAPTTEMSPKSANELPWWDFPECVNSQQPRSGIIMKKLLPCDISGRLAYVRQRLKQIHNHGIVHCDLREPNIMQDSEGNIVIIDFDHAKPKDEKGKAKVQLNMSDEGGIVTLIKSMLKIKVGSEEAVSHRVLSETPNVTEFTWDESADNGMLDTMYDSLSQYTKSKRNQNTNRNLLSSYNA